MKVAMSLETLFYLLLISISLVLPRQVWGVEDWLERGLISLKTQRIEEAIKAFSRAIAANPDRVEAYNNRGIAWCKKGNYDRALADYNKVLELTPRCAEAYNNRGVIWFYKDKYDLAIYDYDKALGIDPRFAKAYSNRGAAWFCKGDIELAINDYNRALEINPNSAETNRQLAWILSVYSGKAKRKDTISAGLEQKGEIPKPQIDPQPALDASFAKEQKPGVTSNATALPEKVGAVKKPEQYIKRQKPDEATGPRQPLRPEEKNKVLAVAPPTHKLTGKPDTLSSSKTAFSIQVGAFSSRENAEKLTALLRDKGYEARLLPLQNWRNDIFYTVRIGDYATDQEAREKAVAFSAQEGIPSTVRPADEL